MPFFIKKPVQIEAVLFDGSNVAELQRFASSDFFEPIHPDDRDDAPELTAQVWDELHNTWVGVKDGQWIIRGFKGEFYPCDPEVFAATYEPAQEIEDDDD